LKSITSLADLAGLPVSEFLLHRQPMLLLDTFIESDEDRTVCEVRIRDDWPFVVAGEGIPAYVGVEIMAQCVAVHAGVRARVAGFEPPLGMLLGTRHFKSIVSWFGVDMIYRVICKELYRDTQGMGSYECTILLNNEPLAEARLAVLEKEQGRRLGAPQ
jgi:predicted hotdog family 3-hydroxylacyl-ACP dehydratase